MGNPREKLRKKKQGNNPQKKINDLKAGKRTSNGSGIGRGLGESRKQEERRERRGEHRRPITPPYPSATLPFASSFSAFPAAVRPFQPQPVHRLPTYVRWCLPYLGQFSGDLTIASTPSNKNSSSCLRFTTVSAPFSSLAGFNCNAIGDKELFKPNSLSL